MTKYNQAASKFLFITMHLKNPDFSCRDETRVELSLMGGCINRTVGWFPVQDRYEKGSGSEIPIRAV